MSLPNAVGVAAFAASPATITSSNSVASQAPVGLPTSALLSLVIMFSDGIERDFSADWRVRYAITVGAALCAVDSGKGAHNAGASLPSQISQRVRSVCSTSPMAWLNGH